MFTEPTWLASFMLELQLLPFLTKFAVVCISGSAALLHLFAYNEKVAVEGPPFFILLGFSFTLLGLAICIYQFDARDMEASFPHLMIGVRTAFFASAIGVFSAVSLKARYILFGAPASDRGREVATLARLIEVVEALDGSFERASKNNPQAWADALLKVMDVFDSNISRQFGENFRHLNSTVAQLLEWQEALISTQTSSAEDLRKASSALAVAASRSNAFVEAASALSPLIEVLNEQRGQVTDSIRAMASLLDKTSISLPQLEGKMLQLTEQMTFGVNRHQKIISLALEQNRQDLKSLHTQFGATIFSAFELFRKGGEDQIGQITDRLESHVTHLSEIEKCISTSLASLNIQLPAHSTVSTNVER